jgi:hypothetical protein
MPWSSESVNTHPERLSPGFRRHRPFYEGILELDTETLLASWAGTPVLDDPRFGLIRGHSSFLEYVRAVREWLVLSDATIHSVNCIDTPMRSVEEVHLILMIGGERRELPVAIVAEWSFDHLLMSVRIYHSLWPLFPGYTAHIPASPTFTAAEPDTATPVAIAKNRRAWELSEIAKYFDSYEDDASLQTLSGHRRSSPGRMGSKRSIAVRNLRGL